jgi:hypothetical protein
LVQNDHAEQPGDDRGSRGLHHLKQGRSCGRSYGTSEFHVTRLATGRLAPPTGGTVTSRGSVRSDPNDQPTRAVRRAVGKLWSVAIPERIATEVDDGASAPPTNRALAGIRTVNGACVATSSARGRARTDLTAGAAIVAALIVLVVPFGLGTGPVGFRSVRGSLSSEMGTTCQQSKIISATNSWSSARKPQIWGAVVARWSRSGHPFQEFSDRPSINSQGSHVSPSTEESPPFPHCNRRFRQHDRRN